MTERVASVVASRPGLGDVIGQRIMWRLARGVMTGTAVVVVLAGCSGDDAAVDARPIDTPVPTVAEADPTPAPTATAVPPTATAVSPTATAVPPTPTGEDDDDDGAAAAIAAVERYFELGTIARSAEPSDESLDIASYTTGDLTVDYQATVDATIDGGFYWEGPIAVAIESTDAFGDSWLVEGCFATDWTRRSRDDDTVLEVEGRLSFEFVAQVDLEGDDWVPSGVDIEEDDCDVSF